MIFFALLLWVARVSASNTPFQIAPSTDSFGADGPWQAVQVGLGTPPQVINLIPAGLYQSMIYSKEVCKGFENVVCGTAGLFDAPKSNTFDNKSMATYHPYGEPFNIGRSGLDTLTLLPAAGNSEGKIEVPKFGMALRFSDNATFADGSGTFPPQIGHISLCDIASQPFGKSDGVSPPVNSSVIPGNLQLNGLIDSLSYGLHVGSGALKLPISLWLGGYDASRVIGAVLSGPFANNGNLFQIDLLDIAFGVDSGASPFPFTSKQGILPSTNPLSVQIDTAYANLRLPTRVCESLTQYLPVTFQSKYGLYMWNTSDPQYTRIVTSPSYLSFTFPAPLLSQGNLTINVPFQLLNLTLFPPMTTTPTSYFPCQAMPSQAVYTLGRAFLQAAFLGANFSKKPVHEWYLAQAPGPNIVSSPSPVAFGQKTTTGASNWSETWKNHWTLLADASPPPANTSYTAAPPLPSMSSSGDLSTSAKIGIVVGVVSFVALILAALFLFRHQRYRREKAGKRQQNESLPATVPEDTFDLAQKGINEAPMPDPVEISIHPGPNHELPTDSELHEALNHSGPIHELPSDNNLYEAPPADSFRRG